MLWVYAGLNIPACDARARQDLPADCIDVSKTPTSTLVDVLLTIYSHQTKGRSIYLGFLDPLLMLSQPDEARCRRVFREFQVYMVVSNPFILPIAWKNGLHSLRILGQQNVETAPPVDDRGAPHVSDEV
jgi:hypothetical protein